MFMAGRIRLFAADGTQYCMNYMEGEVGYQDLPARFEALSKT